MKFKYLGGGFQHGIPARDITDEEYEAFTEDQKRRLIASGLYKAIDEPKPKAVEAKEKHDQPRRQSTS